PEINASNAFIAAWLPGSEGGGVGDLLFRNPQGGVDYDFRGKLSFSWPRTPEQTPLNVGDSGYDPLFAFGYGLDYHRARNLGALAEAPAQTGAVARNDRYFEAGRVAEGWKLSLLGPTGHSVDVTTPNAQSPGGGLALSRVDRTTQEEALLASWNGR